MTEMERLVEKAARVLCPNGPCEKHLKFAADILRTVLPDVLTLTDTAIETAALGGGFYTADARNAFAARLREILGEK